MNRFPRQTNYNPRPSSVKKPEPLSEQRYTDLLKSASDFFALAVEVTNNERKAKIIEITGLMTQYGLSVEDLQ
jgi:hypothetical protein